jgi:uncharacterized protein
MKPSRYNIFIRSHNGATLAFNSASAALAEILPEKLPIIQRLLADPSSAKTDEEKEYLAALFEGRYLIPDSGDEVTSFKVNNRTHRFGNRALLLTIAPTLACNFRCDYCFESQSSIRMNKETEQALLAFAERSLKQSEQLLVTWFGGEPTLSLETIERVQSGLQQRAHQFAVAMLPSAIITNGYLLDGAMATRLQICGVEEAQITLDGPAPIHDSRRKLANGRGTYQRIIENLKQTVDILRISIRINVDRMNVEATFDIFEDLRAAGLLDKVSLYFAQVTSSTTVCADIRDRCLSTEEFSRGQIELYRKLIDAGFYQIEYPMLAPGGHCGADSANAYVVAPNGDLFKCWEELSADSANSVGSVYDTELSDRQRAVLEKYFAWDPFEKSECRECNILPLCMGGCPRQSMNLDAPDSGACCSWKFNLNEMLELRYQCDQRKEVIS